MFLSCGYYIALCACCYIKAIDLYSKHKAHAHEMIPYTCGRQALGIGMGEGEHEEQKGTKRKAQEEAKEHFLGIDMLCKNCAYGIAIKPSCRHLFLSCSGCNVPLQNCT